MSSLVCLQGLQAVQEATAGCCYIHNSVCPVLSSLGYNMHAKPCVAVPTVAASTEHVPTAFRCAYKALVYQM